MAKVNGRRLPLPLPRRWIDDLMRVSRGRPIITFERRMHLEAVAAVRKAVKISWPLLFAKAFAVVAQRRPQLRRAYMHYPWPHLYESEESLASVALERDYHGETGVFFATIREPATQPLSRLQDTLNRWKTAPFESVSDFRRLIRLARQPRLVRRAMWWYGMNASGRIRAIHFGTFGISVTAGTGATALNLIAPVTTTLNYGPFDAEHCLAVRLHFDHRVYDGMTAARALTEMEEILTTEIATELHSMKIADNPAN
jgi:hypothetical protein